MQSNHSHTDTIKCIACKNTIHQKATVCPYCGSSQLPESLWEKFEHYLKVIAGITAVFTLIIVASDLNKLATENLKKHSNAKELVNAASTFWELGDKKTTLSLLKKVDRNYPDFTEATELKSQIGKELITILNPLMFASHYAGKLMITPNSNGTSRYVYNTLHKKEILKELTDINFAESLVLVANSSTGTKRARALAYLAWVELITQRDNSEININTIFDKALKADNEDVIVNVFRAVWLSSDHYKGPLDESNRIEQAKVSFNKALQFSKGNSGTIINGISLYHWIRALQLESLPDIEALKVAYDIHANDGLLSEFSTQSLTRQIFISLSGRGGAPQRNKVKAIENKLTQHFKTEELVDIVSWLALTHYGCTADGQCTNDNYESAQIMYAIGRSYELGGYRQQAYKYYQYAQGISMSGWWKSTFQSALERTKPEENSGK